MDLRHEIVFGKKWFERNQKALLFLLNTPPASKIMRHILDIEYSEPVVFIDPYEVCFSLGKNNYRREFHIARKYGYRLYSRFKYVWSLFHWYDMNVANVLNPKILNLGFDTLTFYPDAHTETYSVDGRVFCYSPGTGLSWADLRAGNINTEDGDGFSFGDNQTSGDCGGFRAWDSSTWAQLFRGVFLFYTASLGLGASVTTATLSLWGTSAQDGDSLAPSLGITAIDPASDTALVGNDYLEVSDTKFASDIAYASWSTVGYNDFSLNSAGKEAISITAASKFCSRNANYDIDNVAPTWSASGRYYRVQCAFADDTTADNGKDPKLVVVYSQAATFTQKHSMII